MLSKKAKFGLAKFLFVAQIAVAAYLAGLAINLGTQDGISSVVLSEVPGLEAQAEFQEGFPYFMPGELLVKFKEKINERELPNAAADAAKVATDKPSVNALLNKYKAKAVKGVIASSKALERMPDFANIKKIEIDGNVEAAVQDFAQDPNVEYAEPNFIYPLLFTPNDPLYKQGNQWALQKERLNAEQAWDTLKKSSSIIIAIIDSGVDYTNEDLDAKMPGCNITTGCSLGTGYDFVNNDNNPLDDYGHGTHVAGIAAAETDNGKGIAGVCPNCKIMPVKVGGASSPTAANIASGLVYAADNGARVANMSFGSSSPSTTLETALNYAYSRNVVLVAAAGNLNHNGKLYPAAYSNVIAVSATSRNDSKSSYSSFGDWVDVSAPGGDGQQQTDWILSTLPKTGT
ncbi:MAG: S8 family serine peptidase, partial [Candidatus Diapherotrites archaeon]|nr:S8 family serine peptidase [Candidatus Diapherotrites archaeon]